MKRILSALILLTIVLSVGCKKEKNDNVSSSINIQMEHKVGNEPVEFDTLKYINAFGHQYSVTKLVYFISDLRVVNASSDTISLGGPFYIDAESDDLKLNVSKKLPEGNYSSLIFTFGLSAAENIEGRFTELPEIGMEWPSAMMGKGYHYMKFEGKYDSLNLDVYQGNFAFHTGPTMYGDYSFQVVLDASDFNVDGSVVDANIVMDLNQWFENPNVYDFSPNQGGIMMNMMVQSKIKANGGSVFSLNVQD